MPKSYDQNVYNRNCVFNGHNIESIATENIFDPHTSAYTQTLAVLCNKCGMPLEDIRKMKPYEEKSKPAAGENAKPSADAGALPGTAAA